MSRSGYVDYLDMGTFNLYRANVDRSIKGKNGQAFLKELLTALEAMPDKKLIRGDLVRVTEGDTQVCAIGAVCTARGLDTSNIDVYNPKQVADAVGIARCLAAEIEFLNDDGNFWSDETDEVRWTRMYTWVKSNISQGAKNEAT